MGFPERLNSTDSTWKENGELGKFVLQTIYPDVMISNAVAISRWLCNSSPCQNSAVGPDRDKSRHYFDQHEFPFSLSVLGYPVFGTCNCWLLTASLVQSDTSHVLCLNLSHSLLIAGFALGIWSRAIRLMSYGVFICNSWLCTRVWFFLDKKVTSLVSYVFSFIHHQLLASQCESGRER